MFLMALQLLVILLEKLAFCNITFVALFFICHRGTEFSENKNLQIKNIKIIKEKEKRILTAFCEIRNSQKKLKKNKVSVKQLINSGRKR